LKNFTKRLDTASTEKDKAFIKKSYLIKSYELKKLMKEFTGKRWKKFALDKLLTPPHKTGTSISTNMVEVDRGLYILNTDYDLSHHFFAQK